MSDKTVIKVDQQFKSLVLYVLKEAQYTDYNPLLHILGEKSIREVIDDVEQETKEGMKYLQLFSDLVEQELQLRALR